MGGKIPTGKAQPFSLVPTPMWAAWVQTGKTGSMRSTRTHARVPNTHIHLYKNSMNTTHA